VAGASIPMSLSACCRPAAKIGVCSRLFTRNFTPMGRVPKNVIELRFSETAYPAWVSISAICLAKLVPSASEAKLSTMTFPFGKSLTAALNSTRLSSGISRHETRALSRPASRLASAASFSRTAFCRLEIILALWLPISSIANPTTRIIQKINSNLGAQFLSVLGSTPNFSKSSTLSPTTPKMTSQNPISENTSQDSSDMERFFTRQAIRLRWGCLAVLAYFVILSVWIALRVRALHALKNERDLAGHGNSENMHDAKHPRLKRKRNTFDKAAESGLKSEQWVRCTCFLSQSDALALPFLRSPDMMML